MRRWIIGVAVLLLIAAFLFLVMDRSLDEVVRQVVEHYGSELTGVKVEVASLDLSLASGGATLRGIHVQNPEGFSSADAFRLHEIEVRIDVGSLSQTPLAMTEVRVLGPEVNIEFDKSGGSNLDRIRRNLARVAEGPTESAGEEESKRLLIREFLLQRGKVRADATALIGKTMELDLPPLQLNDVGGDQGGTPEEIGRTVLTALAEAAMRAVQTELKAEAARSVRERIEDSTKKLLEPIEK